MSDADNKIASKRNDLSGWSASRSNRMKRKNLDGVNFSTVPLFFAVEFFFLLDVLTHNTRNEEKRRFLFFQICVKLRPTMG